MVSNIIDGEGSLLARLQNGVNDAIRYYHEDVLNYEELAHYERLFYLDKFADCKEAEIKSSGYVVDSLEAAIWSLITTDSFKEALLKAVNLGDDTDTVGAITGGLAALYYGYENIPKEWIEVIVKRSGIEPHKKVNQITKDERLHVCEQIKNMRFDITDREDIEGAIITAGGVSTNEIKPNTMESKIVKGLYFTGELIDVDACTGGFNLQIAFSTGYLAGINS